MTLTVSSHGLPSDKMAASFHLRSVWNQCCHRVACNGPYHCDHRQPRERAATQLKRLVGNPSRTTTPPHDREALYDIGMPQQV